MPNTRTTDDVLAEIGLRYTEAVSPEEGLAFHAAAASARDVPALTLALNAVLQRCDRLARTVGESERVWAQRDAASDIRQDILDALTSGV